MPIVFSNVVNSTNYQNYYKTIIKRYVYAQCVSRSMNSTNYKNTL